jgi:cysteine-rich repeat protein
MLQMGSRTIAPARPWLGHRHFMSLVAAALVASGVVSCGGSAPATGIALTIVSGSALASGTAIDAFHLRIRIGDAAPMDADVSPASGAAAGSESVNLLVDPGLAGQTAMVLVDALYQGASMGGGRGEVTLVRHDLVALEVLVRVCLAADGAFCDGDVLVYCVGDRTQRDPCPRGCDPDALRCRACSADDKLCDGDDLLTCDTISGEMSRTSCPRGCSPLSLACNDCTPSTTACDGLRYVVCYADGTVAFEQDCSALPGSNCGTPQCTAIGCAIDPIADGSDCDDGLYCTTGTTCASGACGGGLPLDCDDDDTCTFDTCDELADTCDHNKAAMDGTPCDDGAFCAVGETCDAGLCTGGVMRDCDDQNGCTTDSCNEVGDACVNTYRGDGAPCEDGQFCTSGDTCQGNACAAGSADPCADGNICTTEACDESADACTYSCLAAGSLCLDADNVATCAGDCSPPDVRSCAFGCNSARTPIGCNDCAPSTTACQGDLTLLCNAQITCDATGQIADRRCCSSNRCSCDGQRCLEDVCATAPSLKVGVPLIGDTRSSTDNMPGDCYPGGTACQSILDGGAPDEFFTFTLDDATSLSRFYNVTLDSSLSGYDTQLRVSTVCGSESLQIPNAEVCASPAGTTPQLACGTDVGPEVMVLCGVPEGNYFGTLDSLARTSGDYRLDYTVVQATLDTGAQAGNISNGGVFTGTTCGLVDNYTYPGTREVTGCPASGNNCVGTSCPACDASAATDCRVTGSDSLCASNGAGSSDAVFYLALPVDSGVDISTAGSAFDTVLYLMQSGTSGVLPAGPVRLCNDDCWTVGGASHIQTSLAAGLYYVFLDGAGGVCGDYTLRVTVSPSATCPNLQCEPPFETCVTCPADCPCASCGDGTWRLDQGEQCDDGNPVANDGCSPRCVVEAGYKCQGSPSQCRLRCGDGVIDAGEECDDGNVVGADGCSAQCKIEANFICLGAPSSCLPGYRYVHCPHLAVPDGAVAGISDTITVAGGVTIGDVTVDVDIRHTYVGDLTVSLAAPGGTTVTLHNRSGSSTDNIVGNYDQNLPVDGPGSMNSFNGLSSTGIWTMQVTDLVTTDSGTLECWALNITKAAVCGNTFCEPTESCVTCASDCPCTHCGDGVTQTNEGETCDDGGTTSGDGCSNKCAIESNFVCTGQPSQCLPGVSIKRCPALSIPDNNPTGITDTINVVSAFVVGDVTADVGITHAYPVDLAVSLRSPANTPVTLHNGSAGTIYGNYDLQLPVDGPGRLDDFNGQAANGAWRLTAIDSIALGTGTIDCWTLNLRSAPLCGDGKCSSAWGETCGSCPGDCTCPRCPNGVVNPGDGEVCDDNNATAADGCGVRCDVEPGWICSGQPSSCIHLCGNGSIDSGETCDDSNFVSGDGCSNACRQETGFVCRGVPSVCRPVQTISNCPNRNIANNSTFTVNQTFPTACSIFDVTVDVDVLHTYIGDLILTLKSPSNVTRLLHNGEGGSADNIIGNYDITLTPSGGSMDIFDGTAAQGAWSLTVQDTAPPDTGTLRCWSVRIACQ